MARITKGILGGFSGKVGTVVGSNWRGIDIIRSTPKPSSRPASSKQLVQQMKFKTAVAFLQPLRSIQNRFFGSNSGAKSRSNLATSYTINNAVDMVDDLPVMIFNKVLITKGDLASFQNIAVTPQAGGILAFTWGDNANQGNASATDLVSIVCFSDELGVFEIYEGAEIRSRLSLEVTLPAFYVGKEIQVYAYLNNEQETQASNSTYLGAITVL